MPPEVITTPILCQNVVKEKQRKLILTIDFSDNDGETKQKGE